MGKKKHCVRSLSAACLTAAALLLGTGCSSDKGGMAVPELPARYWLDDAPGIPVEHKDKYDAAVPNLYKADKKFNFEDCVYLTLQQSPVLVNSAVKIEINRLQQTDAAWQYLPELHMTLRVSQNVTKKNEGKKSAGKDYGQVAYEYAFYAPFPNPVATYFTGKARAMMTGVAISTHRKACGDVINKIGQAYLELQARQFSLACYKSLVPVMHEMTEYYKEVARVEGSHSSAVQVAQQREHEAELDLQRAIQEETIQRTQLKILAGLDPRQKFDIDATNADSIVANFDGKKIRWEEVWNDTEDNLLLRVQLKLYDYNILLAWAQYFPGISLAVNMSAPRGQSNDQDNPDQFAHLSFDFPLLDWGRRYRGVQQARMQKAQAYHQMNEKRISFANDWMEAEQKVELALTNLKLMQSRYKTAQMQYEESRISYEAGDEQLPTVADRQSEMVRSQIRFINAQRDYRLAKLNWMYKAGLLQRQFLGLPSKELSDLVGGNRPVAPRPSFETDDPVFSGLGSSPLDRERAGQSMPKTDASARPVGNVRPEKIPPLPDEAAEAPKAGVAAPAQAGAPKDASGDLSLKPTL